MFSSKVVVPSDGSAIVIDDNGKLIVPDNPIVPFIRGDGIGADITPVMKKVVDAAVAKAYQGKKKIAWMEIYAGGRSVRPSNNSCRRWYPFIKRSITSDSRFIYLSASCSLLCGCSITCKTPRVSRYRNLP